MAATDTSATNGSSPSANGDVPRRSPRVAIIGAGMSGICMAAKLRGAGIESFTLYEKRATVGGTWRENTYPGLTCDIPSRYYSYTFAPNPDWSHVYSPGAEIWDYLERVTDDLGIRERIRFETEVAEATWTGGRWRLRTQAGDEDDYDFIVSACGVLHHPRTPEIPGLESFAGAAFHSARWDHSVALEGKRVGVVGSGSTGVQIVGEIAERVERLEHFNRTPQWIFPMPNRSYRGLTRRLYNRFPALPRIGYRVWQELYENSLAHAMTEPGLRRRMVNAVCRGYLRLSVRDPELRRRLTPRDRPMCKRLVISSDFYAAMQRPNVELVEQPIERVEERGIVTADGRLHELDVIVLATGFHAHRFLRPVELVVPGGKRLSEVWKGEPRAYRTVALPGFPNFFMVIGPHSPFGNQSLITIAETQAEYIVACMEPWRMGRAQAMSPRQEPTDRYYRQMLGQIPRTIWVSGCQSWYIGEDGLPFNFPWTPDKHREMLAEPAFTEWEMA